MAVQTPPIPAEPNPQVDDGVIEDARRRQRRHRLVGLLAIFVAVAIGLIVGSGSGSGGNHGGGQGPGSSARGPGGAVHVASADFPGAPASQNVDGVASGECPLAPANRYLPARSGCVTAMRADMTGDGRADLVIVYSHLNHTSAYYAGGPAAWKHYFGAGDATIEVVLPGGKTISTRLTAIRAPGYSVNAAAIIAVKHVSDEPGDEFFLQITQISSGSTALAYGLADGRLVPSGVLLHYGGDSAQRAGFSCQAATRTPELVQRTFLLGDAPALGARARWMGTKLTYAWHGPRLVKIHTQTIHAAGHRPPSQLVGGSGCGPVKS